MRAFQLAASVNWMIREESLKLILEIAQRKNVSLEQAEEEAGRKFNNQHNFEVVNGVAIIDVIGPIFRYADIFTAISGATSVSSLTRDLDAALADDSIHSILLNVDSPGGEANGIHEFSEKIFNARDQKNIEAYVSGSGCSAAYWIASSAKRITTDAMASLGSIGVACVIQDDTEADEAMGIKTYKFVSSKSPNKRPDLDTEEGRDVIQENIDAMADVFISKVARNRAVTADDVVEKFGHGGVLIGKQAVKAGLADSLGSFDQVLNRLTKSGGSASSNANAASLGKNTKETLDMSLKDKVNSEFENENAAATDATADVAANASTETAPAEAAASVIADAAVADAAAAVDAAAAAATATQTAAATTLIDGKTPEELLAEINTLRAAAAKAETEKVAALENALKIRAEQAASTYLTTNKILPAQKDKFLSGYMTAAKDDERNPIEGFKRLDNFLAMFDEKAPHILTDEMVDAEATSTLLGTKEDSDKQALLDKQLEEQARQHAQNVNKKNKK